MLKFALTALTTLALLSSLAHSDGLPLCTETHDVYGNNLQVKITPKQKEEISAKGSVTFSKQQLALIKKFYPKAPNNIIVYTPTFNDCMCDQYYNTVYCIWTKPNVVAITLNQINEKDYTFPTANGETDDNHQALIRLSPEGDIYSKGKQVTLTEAKQLMLKKENHERCDGDLKYIRYVAPPKYRRSRDADLNKKVLEIIKQIEAYGKTIKLEVYPSW